MESLSVFRLPEIRDSLHDFLGIDISENPIKLFDIFSRSLSLLKEAKGVPASLYRRVFYINCTFEKVLIAPELRGHDWDIVSTLIVEIARLKSSLQLEAVCVGILKVVLQERYYFLHEKSLESSRALFGDGSYFIADVDKPEEKRTDLASLPENCNNFESFIDSIRGISICDEPETFDMDLLELTQGYKFSGNNIFIVDPASERVAERYLSSDHPITKAIAEFLFYLHRSERHQKENATLSDTSAQTVKYIKGLDSANILRMKSLIPALARLITLRKECESTGKSFNGMLLERSFLDQFMPTINDESQVFNADAYELLIKIEAKWREVFDHKFPKRPQQTSLNTDIFKVGRDQFPSKLGDGINERLRRNKEPFSFPIHSEFPFCRGRAEFSTLCDLQEIFKKANLQKKLIMSTKSRGVPIACGAGSGAGASVAPCEVDCDDEVRAEVPVLPKMPLAFGDIQIAERVHVWQISGEEGIAFYLAAKSRGVALPESEMILRHRLPLNLVNLLLNPSYSKKGEWRSLRGEIHDHFIGLLYIDTKKYILEATFDKENVLYHFYARELRVLSDYSMSLYSPFEFPLLTATRKLEASAPITTGSELGMDEMGNGHIDFDGRHYQLLKLR